MMDFEEFMEHLKEQGEYHCYCNATEFPPCTFCEGGAVEMYENYLKEDESE